MSGGAGSEALVGRIVGGKFVVGSKIGEGAMGAVYRARQQGLDRDVAVKVLHTALASDPSFAARFQREAKAASRLDHPNVVRVIDYGQEADGVLYIAMELLEGRDLFRLIDEDWPLPQDRIVDLLSQTLAALAVAHDAGILHRDLKPENIMVLRRRADDGAPMDVVKVCDFGIAKMLEGDEPPATSPDARARKLSTAGVVIGTPEYMSPEQARGEAIDARSDVYAVGVILYQMLTRRLPYEGNTPLSVVIKALQEAPRPIDELGPTPAPALEPICMRALAKRREDRWPGARAMRAALREAAALPGVSAPAIRLAPLASAPTLAGSGTLEGAETQRAPAPAESSSSPASIPTGAGAQVHGPAEAPRAPEERPSRARSRRAWGWGAALAAAGVAAWGLSTRGERPRPRDEEARSALPSPEPTASAPVPAAPPIAVTAPPPAVTAATAPSNPRPALVPAAATTPPSRPRARPEAPAEPLAESVLSSVPPPPLAIAAPAPAAAPSPAASSAQLLAPAPPPPSAAPRPPPLPAPDLSRARVDLGQPRSNNAAATALGITRGLSPVAPRLTACWRAALAQATTAADDLTASLHLETDDQGYATAARVSGAVPPVAARCIEAAVVRDVRIDVDTGTASADVPLTLRVR